MALYILLRLTSDTFAHYNHIGHYDTCWLPAIEKGTVRFPFDCHQLRRPRSIKQRTTTSDMTDFAAITAALQRMGLETVERNHHELRFEYPVLDLLDDDESDDDEPFPNLP